MAILVVVFLADLFTCEKCKGRVLGVLTAVLLTAQIGSCFLLGGEATAFGDMYVSTAAANVMKVVLTLGALIVCIMANPWLEQPAIKKIQGEFYTLIVATLLGMYFMISSGHFVMFFLGLEMASVPMACLVAFDRKRRESAEGAAKFILTATFSSGIMMFGISMLYAVCGTLYFDDCVAKLTAEPLAIMGMVFFFSGLGFKLSLVPFHFWTADAYQGAPTAVTGYLSVVSKGAAAFALMTILMKVFPALATQWTVMLYILIVLSITVANVFAIRQSELKRFMAFSSISQAGYIMLAVLAGTTTDYAVMGVTALTYYVLVYVVANMSVFTVINVIEQKNQGKTMIADYNGLYGTNPKLSFLLTLALFSLAGIPPFAGMFSKFFVFMAACQSMDAVAYGIVFIALVNTVISLYYYLLIVKAMYINKSENPIPTFKSDCWTRLALFLCTAGVVGIGVCSFIYDWINAASAL